MHFSEPIAMAFFLCLHGHLFLLTFWAIAIVEIRSLDKKRPCPGGIMLEVSLKQVLRPVRLDPSKNKQYLKESKAQTTNSRDNNRWVAVYGIVVISEERGTAPLDYYVSQPCIDIRRNPRFVFFYLGCIVVRCAAGSTPTVAYSV